MIDQLGNHVRGNFVGYVALIVALAGVPTAWALGKSTVGTKQLKPGAVHTGDIARSAVTSPRIKDGVVSGDDVAEETLGQVPSAKAADNAGLLDELDSTDFLRSDAAAGGDLSGNYPNPQIASGAVGSPELASAAVNAGKIGTVVIRTVVQAVTDGDADGDSANAFCNAGEQAVGGGGSLSSFVSDVPLISSRPTHSSNPGVLPADGNTYDGWRATAINPAGGTVNVSVRAHVLCLQP